MTAGPSNPNVYATRPDMTEEAVPVPCSSPITSAASAIAATCPSQTPVRLSRVVSSKQVVGVDRYLPVPRPSMGGEDFAYYAEQVPACFFLVGVQPTDAPGYPPLHSDRYDFTDAAIGVGVRMFVELVLQYGK